MQSLMNQESLGRPGTVSTGEDGIHVFKLA
jgi:acetyl-CoA C-acetyltransferase